MLFMRERVCAESRFDKWVNDEVTPTPPPHFFFFFGFLFLF